ncbi:EamA family transporter [Fischerella thermalis CCMEE 5201]|jgi:drug/metabolite transporter (DMT)-like permease|nr:EamA family transporter [Fischerella thermalis CCMEE 5201]
MRISHLLFIPPQLYLLFAVLIFGAANPVTRKLTEIGAKHLIDGRNPVSLCNVLFVGNLCALLVLLVIYRQQLKPSKLGRFTSKQWLNLTVVAILSGAIAPGLIFQALGLTMVNNVVLVGRLEPPLTLLLSIWLLRERVNFWEIFGALVSFIGVILTISLPETLQSMTNIKNYFSVGTGEILTAIAAVALATSTIIAKAKFSQIPLGIYSTFRTALGTVIFFFLALLLYGKHHFTDAFSPFLWKWMLIYGPLIVVVGQSFWIAGLRASSVSQASLASSFTPIAGIVAAYLILDEVPTFAQYVGGSVILIGIFLSQIGIWRKQSLKQAKSSRNYTQNIQQIENGTGFKGI